MLSKFTLTLATQNQGKQKEIIEVLQPFAVEVILAPKNLNVLEDGHTFEENAYKKAKAYWDEFKTPILADDSGLELEDFPELLGVQTAYFGSIGHAQGEKKTDAEKCKMLLEVYERYEKLHKVNLGRGACFRSVLCYYQSDSDVYFFEGRLKGKIATQEKGLGGFGYDPIFIPEVDGLTHNTNLTWPSNATLAEMQQWKNIHSHRAKALHYFTKFLKDKV